MSMVSTSNAQFLQYKLGNFSSTDSWTVELDDDCPTGIYLENLASGDGAIKIIPKFQFPLQYKVESSSGCQAIGAFTSTTTSAGAIISTTCPTVDIVYTLIMVKPDLYRLKMKFN